MIIKITSDFNRISVNSNALIDVPSQGHTGDLTTLGVNGPCIEAKYHVRSPLGCHSLTCHLQAGGTRCQCPQG